MEIRKEVICGKNYSRDILMRINLYSVLCYRLFICIKIYHKHEQRLSVRDASVPVVASLA